MTYVVCHLPIVPNEKATNPLCSMGKVQTVNLTQSSSEGKLPTKQTCSQCSLSLCWSLTLLLPFITACSQIDFTLLFHFTVKAFCTYRCMVWCACVCTKGKQYYTLLGFFPLICVVGAGNRLKPLYACIYYYLFLFTLVAFHISIIWSIYYYLSK